MWPWSCGRMKDLRALVPDDIEIVIHHSPQYVQASWPTPQCSMSISIPLSFPRSPHDNKTPYATLCSIPSVVPLYAMAVVSMKAQFKVLYCLLCFLLCCVLYVVWPLCGVPLLNRRCFRPELSAWRGAALYASSQAFQEFRVTREDFQEKGHAICAENLAYQTFT